MNQLQRAGDDGLTAGDVARIGAALEASIAPNTAKAYRAALDRFAAWLDGRPVTDTTVAAYVAALMDDGYAPATIKQAAAAIGAGARAQGQPDPLEDRSRARRLPARSATTPAKAGARSRVSAARTPWPRAAAAAAQGTVSGLRDAALLRTMSDALLRASEVAAIATADIEREGDGSGRLAIRRSKTDQEAEGAVCYLVPATMTALDAWLRAAAAAWTSSGRYEGPIFRRVTRSGAVSGHAPLTTSAVRAIVRKRAAAVGVTGASGHSCRVGSAQSLIERGASTAAVAIAGRWKDPGMVVRYAKAQEAGRGAVKAYFGGGK